MNASSAGFFPTNFTDWPPIAQACAIGLSTFAQEDIPALGSALLVAMGLLDWKTGFLGVFLGIWVGDALLYLLARWFGRPLLEHRWARRFHNPAALARGEQWLRRHGHWILFSCRFLPGTRLPTYLAAGFLRLPIGRFLTVTGLAVAVWTIALFLLALAFGEPLAHWLKHWGLLGSLAVLISVAIVYKGIGSVFRGNLRRRLSASIGRFTRWEFWPAWLFYIPVGANYLRLAIRHRGLTVPTAANPGIFAGGFVGESKFCTLQDLMAAQPDFTAEAHLIQGSTPAERLHSFHALCTQHSFRYPLILKPDLGQRGVGVRVIRSSEQAQSYLNQSHAPTLVQRYIPGPLEVGIFYYRHPNESTGRIFAITEKLFPHITGDGSSTIEDLVWADPRARYMAETYLTRLGSRSLEVLPSGQSLKLVEAGNHAQGSIFQDGKDLWSEPLERRIDSISKSIDGFFIGRYDIRYRSNEELRAGTHFKIIELNGATAEATSIYDARNSLCSAYRTLFRQWELVFSIGDANRQRGIVPTPLTSLWRAWRHARTLASTYPMAD